MPGRGRLYVTAPGVVPVADRPRRAERSLLAAAVTEVLELDGGCENGGTVWIAMPAARAPGRAWRERTVTCDSAPLRGHPVGSTW